MILDVLNQYWIVYGMLGIFGIGVLSRLWLNHIYKSLLKDTRNTETPRKMPMTSSEAFTRYPTIPATSPNNKHKKRACPDIRFIPSMVIPKNF